MRGYLLDENLPDRLPISSTYPIYHVRALGMCQTDSDLWAVARREHWVIVSKDADFAERVMMVSPPPWVVHLRIGNLRLAEFRAFVGRVWPRVEGLLPANKLINVYHDHIEAIGEQAPGRE